MRKVTLQYAFVKITNSTNSVLTVQYTPVLKNSNECSGCEDSTENSVSITIMPGETIEGGCHSIYGSLGILLHNSAQPFNTVFETLTINNIKIQ